MPPVCVPAGAGVGLMGQLASAGGDFGGGLGREEEYSESTVVLLHRGRYCF